MKALGKNNVSIKDFFSVQRNTSCSRGEGNISDSAIDNSSQSQFPFSQIDFPDTQEHYSQNAQMTRSPQTSQYNRSPGRRSSSLFGKMQLNPREVQGGPSTSMKTSSYQNQVQMHKKKAKERDERDALQLVVSSVRDCTADIQVAVDDVKKKIQHGLECSENSMTHALNEIHCHLKECTSNINTSVEVKTDLIKKVSGLEKAVSQLLKENDPEQQAEMLKHYFGQLQGSLDQQFKQFESVLVDKVRKLNQQQEKNLKLVSEKLWEEGLAELKKHKSDSDDKAERVQQEVERKYEEELKVLKERYQKEVAAIMAEESHPPRIEQKKSTMNQARNLPPQTFRPHLSCFSPTVLIDKTQQQSSAQPFNDYSTDAPNFNMSRNAKISYQPRGQSFSNFSTGPTSKQQAKEAKSREASSKEQPILISPFLRNRTWTSSKSLFTSESRASESRASPIATVRPITRTQAAKAYESTQQQSQTQLATQTATQSDKKKRKRKAPKFTKKKRKSARLNNRDPSPSPDTQHEKENESEEEEEEDATIFVAPQSESIFEAGYQKSKDSRFDIYGLHDEEESRPAPLSLRGDMFRRTSYKRSPNRAATMGSWKPRASNAPEQESSQDDVQSLDSSPSLSITDFVIRRKIKQEKASPSLQDTLAERRPNSMRKKVGYSSTTNDPPLPVQRSYGARKK